MSDVLAAGQLRITIDSGRLHLGTVAAPDWLGPATVLRGGSAQDVRPDLRRGEESSASADRATTATPFVIDDDGRRRITIDTGRSGDGVLVVTIEALVDIDRSATGITAVADGLWFAPAERHPDGAPPELRAFGHQYTEFGLPVQADAALSRFFHLPFRPACVFPLWLTAADGSAILLAPLDAFHEQVLTFPDDPSTDDPDRSGLRWGWHGDLVHVPAGWSSSLAVLGGASPRSLLDRWVALLAPTPNLAVDADTLGRQVSYWTDNGAAYWYRTEAPRSVPETIGDAVASVEHAGIPVGAVQIDSWFYPHETTRPFDTDEWVVPPSGLIDWAPRSDILPDGVEAIAAAVDGRALVAHCRHLSSQSPRTETFDCWIDDAYAHPTGDDYYEDFLDRARSWGVETFEHDWLVECWAGVHGLRAEPGRPRAWQEGIDRAAAERDMTLQWCMATPADLFQTATLGRVTSIRTSGDHGYLVGPGFLWAWFCYTNALARAFGLAPFKDVFLSGGEHAEVEALLSALSTGPVGLGDAIDTTDAAVAAATCRADGTIVRPDVPIAAVDASIRSHAVSHPVPLVAECHTDHGAGRWTQVFCANTFRRDERIDGVADLGVATPTAPVVRLDLRTGAVDIDATTSWDLALAPAEWTHHLLAPILAADIAVFGVEAKHAPVGRALVPSIDVVDGGVRVSVAGTGDEVAVSGVRVGGGVHVTVDGEPADADDGRDAPSGVERWSVAVTAPATVEIIPA